MMDAPTRLTVAELLGDGISPELSRSLHAVAAALPIPVAFEPVDLSLERRRKDAEGAYVQAEETVRRLRLAMKHPTATEADSPNAALRARLGFTVIHRPVKTIPGVPTRFSGTVDLHVVRVATGGTYEDAGRRVGLDSAVSVRVVERRPCSDAAFFAFQLAGRLGSDVVSASKYTIQRVTDGLFEEAVTEVETFYPHIRHRKMLFDALLAKLTIRPEDFSVIVTLNEYGDFLSDAACGLVGSVGLGASASYAFDEKGRPSLGLFDPAGGTAPDIAGKGVVNPSASLLAFEMLLVHAGRPDLGRAVGDAVRGAIEAGRRTVDLGGDLGTEAFTEAVVERLRRGLGG